MISRMPVVLVGSLSLVACASQTPYSRPLTELPSSYRNIASGTAQSAVVQADDRWWTAFDDPVLNRLVEEALVGSLDVEAARARLQQAAAASRVARSASFPSATLGGSAAVQRQSLDEPIARIASTFPGYERTGDLYGLSAAASWEIDLFGRLSAARLAARADEASASAGVVGARLTVAAEIATTYIGARELQRRIEIAHERTRTLGELDRLVRLRVVEGAAARLEAEQVEADLAAARARILALEAALEPTLNRIDVLAGRAPGQAAAELGEGRLPAAVPVDVQDGPAGLLRRRPDIIAAERRVAAADARAAQAVADYYPRVTISGLVGLLSSGLPGLFAGNALQTAGSAGFSGRLFDFGVARGRVEGAQGRTREAVADYRATVLRAVAEVEDGLSTRDRRSRQAQQLEASEAALTRARDISRLAYQGGAVSLIEALDAERRLLEVQDEATTARADAARARVALSRALGGGWDASRAVAAVGSDGPV
ncbi:efflux transporter outer membrane subunit [Phenylobacterium sp. LjRoot225]|uniref:efflux transporter outer membrane subunit n=1 Tax=Phenylobacterium sp. LjRoot225 TaxID=3342285 RepID=UPI003ECC38AC